MSDGWNIALLGATGAVGGALLELLAERRFPVKELFLLAGEQSVGESRRYCGKTYSVQDARQFDWTQAQLAFFVAGQAAAERYAQEAAVAGCLVIDNSGLFALQPDVPLVVPDVNAQVLEDYRNRNIIAVADSLTAQLLCAIKPFMTLSGISCLQVTNLLAASAGGKAAVEALAGESARLLNGMPVENPYFGHQLAFNLLPLTEDNDGSVETERRLVDQVRKVVQDEGLSISVSTVKAPVFYGNAQSVQVETAQPCAIEEIRDALRQTEDIHLLDEGNCPTPVGNASGETQLSLGCLRYDYGQPERIQFWSVADNIRFGGALMMLKTAEKLLQEYLY